MSYFFFKKSLNLTCWNPFASTQFLFPFAAGLFIYHFFSPPPVIPLHMQSDVPSIRLFFIFWNPASHAEQPSQWPFTATSSLNLLHYLAQRPPLSGQVLSSRTLPVAPLSSARGNGCFLRCTLLSLHLFIFSAHLSLGFTLHQHRPIPASLSNRLPLPSNPAHPSAHQSLPPKGH